MPSHFTLGNFTPKALPCILLVIIGQIGNLGKGASLFGTSAKTHERKKVESLSWAEASRSPHYSTSSTFLWYPGQIVSAINIHYGYQSCLPIDKSFVKIDLLTVPWFWFTTIQEPVLFKVYLCTFCSANIQLTLIKMAYLAAGKLLLFHGHSKEIIQQPQKFCQNLSIWTCSHWSNACFYVQYDSIFSFF